MKTGKKFYIEIALMTLLFSFAIWKTHFGMHSDEVHSIALGDMVARGNALFKECWFYLQMSSVFTAPIIWGYVKIVGSTDGILLFFRVISVIIQVLICFCFYRTFSKNYKKSYVIVAGIILFTFIPDFQSFNYKQELIWFTTLEIIFLYRFYLTGKVKYLIGLGIMLSGCVLAYPTSIVSVPAYLLIIYKLSRIKEKEQHMIWKDIFTVILTCFVCALLFLSYVMSKITITEFISFFPKVLSDNNLDSSFVAKLMHPFVKFMILGIGCTGSFYLYKKIGLYWNKGKKIPIISVLLLTAFVGQCFIERNGVTWHCVTYPYSLTIFIMPLLHWSDNKTQKYNRELILVFEYPAIMTVLSMALASNQGNITSMYGTVFSTIGCILLLGNRGQEENSVCFWEKKGILAVLLICALSMYFVPVWEQESINSKKYGQRTIFTRRTEVTYGPAKGIWMGEESYRQYRRICSIIENNVSVDDKVFIIADHYTSAYGYLNNPGDYATYSPQGGWGVADSDTAIQYFSANPDRQPSVVIIDMDYVERSLNEYMLGTPIGIYLNDHNYVPTAEENGYTVLKSST